MARSAGADPSGTDGTGRARARHRRADLLLIGAVAVLLVVALVAVLLSRQHTATYAEGSPEATAQAYLSAVVAGDTAEAARHLDPDRGCTAANLEVAYIGDAARVVLRESQVDGETARVRVEVVSGGGMLSGPEWVREETLRLRRDAASETGWVVTGVPWPAYECAGRPEEEP